MALALTFNVHANGQTATSKKLKTERQKLHGTPKKPQSQGPATSSTGVIPMFAAAQKLYNAGKFPQALVAFDRIMKRYPGHEPTIIQYAKTLYKLDRITESYNLFARINPQYLDPETSYEYGYASYVNSRWDAALFSFKRVPSEHALYDLANYYGALAAIKLKKYADAEEMLDKAVVLPDKLAKSRSMYQKHVQSLRHLQEKSDLDQATIAEKNRLAAAKSQLNAAQAAPQPPPQTGASTTSDSSKPVEGEPYVHQGFYSVNKSVKVSVSKDHQVIDKHGFNETTFDNDLAEFKFSYGPTFPLSFNKTSFGSGAFGLQFNLGVSDTNSKGRQERIVVYEDSRDIPRVLGDDIPATHLVIGKAGVETWLEFAVANNWWAGALASLNFEYPEFKRGQRTSSRSAAPQIGKKFKFGNGKHSGNILGQYRFEQLTDSETNPLVDVNSGLLETEISLASDTVFLLGLYTYHFNYQLVTMGGPDTTNSGSLKVTQNFPLGFSASLAGTGGTTTNHIVRGLPTFGDASADGTILSGRAKISAGPIPWFKLSGEYQVAKTSWTVLQEDRVDAFKKNVNENGLKI
ncbi:MAG: tetratricopeptide repeat protein [Proteobacteria bacterium]|nr:tetratricopeptide repeat protein [Pseudomonadota bacterium]